LVVKDEATLLAVIMAEAFVLHEVSDGMTEAPIA
jgi:hypothetical protein